MASSLWKLNALIKKNLLEMKRNILSTICEIFFPIILIFIFFMVRVVFEVKTHDFLDEESPKEKSTKSQNVSTLQNFIRKRSTTNFNYSTLFSRGENFSNITWNGMSIHSPLHICTEQNEKGKPRPRIAVINVPQKIIDRIIDDYNLFNDPYIFNGSNFSNFSSISEFNDYIRGNSYGDEDLGEHQICFGINFKEKVNNTYEYSLHYFDNKIMNGADDIPASLYILDQFQVGPDMDEYEKYQFNGYTYIMKVINDYIIQEETKNIKGINFGVLPMRYESYRTDSFGGFLNFIGPFFIIIGYMGHLCMYAYKMVVEKETKAKEGMKIMGLTDGIYFLSYFIQYTIISLFDALVNALIFLKIFKQIPFIVSFLMFYLFSLNVFALAFFFQSFIDKSKETLVISMLVYFNMFFLSLLVPKKVQVII